MAMPARAGVALTCSTYRLPVRIADPGAADQILWGQLCYPGSARPDKVQLLVPGSTYNHLYWDFPVGNGFYSYVKAAVGAGYATFNVDRIGTGNSSHPPSAQLDLPAGAVAMHDVITALRSGALDGHAFSRVAWIGHSLGSFLAWYEISRYHDVDAAILTGGLQAINPQAGTIIYPAVQDPKFANSGLDTGYVTTLPGDRNFFYYPATADPNVIAADEANKDVATVTPSPSCQPRWTSRYRSCWCPASGTRPSARGSLCTTARIRPAFWRSSRSSTSRRHTSPSRWSRVPATTSPCRRRHR